MAIIKCIECGKEFSDKAAACPNCGCPTSETTGVKKDESVSITLPIQGPSSEEATKQMMDAVEEAKRAASSADRDFDWENSKIQRMASGSIGLFDNDAVTRVADISMEAKKACDTLYAALQMTLMTLDRTCRPLLMFRPDGTAIRDVYYEIKQLNSDSEISNTFTASLNYNNLGDVATRRYSPSLEAKMIENFWQSEYEKIKKDMERIAAEKRAKDEEVKKRAAEQKKKEMEAFQAANKTLIDDYAVKAQKTADLFEKMEKESFEKKKDEVIKRLEEEKKKAETSILENAKSKMEAIKSEKAVIDLEYVDTIRSLRGELGEKKAVLPTLGLFKFAEKKAVNASIEELVDKLQKATGSYKEKAAKFEREANECEDEKQKELKKERDAIEARFPIPEMVQYKKTVLVKERVEVQPTPTQLVNEAMKDAIYEYLLTVDLVTIVDIMNECPEVCDMTNQRVSALVRQMLTEGRVERIEEKRKAFFRAVDGYSTSGGKKQIPEKESNPIEQVENFVKNKPVSLEQIKINGKNNAPMEEYVKYGCLKFLALDGKIYCEESKDMFVHYIPEEYRKMN